MPDKLLRIGALAAQTGLTVRALRHYDAEGLLQPRQRSEAGHRLYSQSDLARLQQIVSLRDLGLPLGEIRRALDSESALEIVERHFAHVTGRIEADTRLAQRLGAVADHVRRIGAATARDLVSLIQLTTMFEKHYTPDQRERLEKQEAAVGTERMEAVHGEWKNLFEEAARHMTAGRDPAGPAMQGLAVKAEKLVGEFTGGAPDIRSSLRTAVKSDPTAMYKAWGVDPDLGAYYSAAMAARWRSQHGDETS